MQCFMQRPVQPSYGRVKQNVDGCLFVWTGITTDYNANHFHFLCTQYTPVCSITLFMILFYSLAETQEDLQEILNDREPQMEKD